MTINKFKCHRRVHNLLFSPLLILSLLIHVNCQEAVNVNSEVISCLRDSLENTDYLVPEKPQMKGKKKVACVRSIEEWKQLTASLQEMLEEGYKNIVVNVRCDLIKGAGQLLILDLDYPDVNIRINGEKAKYNSYNTEFTPEVPNLREEGDFFSYPYNSFRLDDFIADENGREIPLREDVRQVNGNIVRVQGFKSSSTSEATKSSERSSRRDNTYDSHNEKDDVWRFQIDLPNLSEEQCKDFYVLLTRDWTSARHRVVMVKDGWLYFHLDSDDLHSDCNPNVDWNRYKVRPRYRLINNPVSKGVHVVNGRIYIPKQYQKVSIRKGARLLTVKNCHFNSMVVSGFKIDGCGMDWVMAVNNSRFETGMFITNNHICHINYYGAIILKNSDNVVISENTITDTRNGAIYMEQGNGTTICGNHLKNIGWMLNTMAIKGSGDRLHICDNVIEDFNYSAISVGSRAATRDSIILNYIIERNVIRHNVEYNKNYITNTLSDGGGIYTGPSCTSGIIRNNVIIGIKGIHSNRGIFLDDGAKNLSIYGNLILNTANSYDIDLRKSNVFMKTIPDHNTNNVIFHNILTGGYRFQDTGHQGNGCMGGQNLLLGLGNTQKTVVDINKRAADHRIKGCGYKNGKVVVPKFSVTMLDTIRVSDFVQEYIIIK